MDRKWFSLLLFFLFVGCAPMATRVALPQSSVPYERAWQVALSTSLNYYDRIAIEDKEGGFFQTAWNLEKSGLVIGIPVRRNRLIGHVASKTPFRLHLTLEVEAFSMELGRWVKETNDPLLTQIAQDMSSKLQF